MNGEREDRAVFPFSYPAPGPIPLYEDETVDDLQRSGLRILQKCGGLRFGEDAVLLAHHAASLLRTRNKQVRVADIGCGSGILLLLLASRLPQVRLTGIERVPSLAELASRNVRLNGLADRIRVVEGDIRDRHVPGESGFDLCISNPPYHMTGRGKPPADPVRAAATVSATLTADDLAAAARRLLRTHGTLVVSCRPAQLVDLMVACRGHGLEPKTLREVLPAPGRPASLLLMTAVAGGRAGGFSIATPLVVRDLHGTYTEEVQGIYTGEGIDPARLMDGLVRTAGAAPFPSDAGGLR